MNPDPNDPFGRPPQAQQGFKDPFAHARQPQPGAHPHHNFPQRTSQIQPGDPFQRTNNDHNSASRGGRRHSYAGPTQRSGARIAPQDPFKPQQPEHPQNPFAAADHPTNFHDDRNQRHTGPQRGRPDARRNLFLKKVPPQLASEHAIKNHFGVNSVLKVSLRENPPNSGRRTAVITFDSEESATYALQHSSYFQNRQLLLNYFGQFQQPQDSTPPNNELVFTNVPPELFSDDAIKNLFNSISDNGVVDVSVKEKPFRNGTKRTAIITLVDIAHATTAVQNLPLYNGHKLAVSYRRRQADDGMRADSSSQPRNGPNDPFPRSSPHRDQVMDDDIHENDMGNLPQDNPNQFPSDNFTQFNPANPSQFAPDNSTQFPSNNSQFPVNNAGQFTDNRAGHANPFQSNAPPLSALNMTPNQSNATPFQTNGANPFSTADTHFRANVETPYNTGDAAPPTSGNQLLPSDENQPGNPEYSGAHNEQESTMGGVNKHAASTPKNPAANYGAGSADEAKQKEMDTLKVKIQVREAYLRKRKAFEAARLEFENAEAALEKTKALKGRSKAGSSSAKVKSSSRAGPGRMEGRLAGGLAQAGRERGIGDGSKPGAEAKQQPGHVSGRGVASQKAQDQDTDKQESGNNWRGVGEKVDIEKAKALVGTCQFMCPDKEFEERYEQDDVSQFEKTDGYFDRHKAVKKYRRSAAISEQPRPKDVRPINVLHRTLLYLRGICDADADFSEIHHFVRDRTRSLRQDLTLQGLKDDECIQIHEESVRFHILSEHRLFGEDLAKFVPKQNREQLDKCLISLREFYQVRRDRGLPTSPNEPEMQAYYLMTQMSNLATCVQLLSGFKDTPDILHSVPVQFALRVMRSSSSLTGNAASFFRCVRKAPYLAACLMHSRFTDVRKRALHVMNHVYGNVSSQDTFSITTLTHTLGFEDFDEAITFCETLACDLTGLDGPADEVNLLTPSKNFNEANISMWVQRKAENLIESKIRGQRISDIISQNNFKDTRGPSRIRNVSFLTQRTASTLTDAHTQNSVVARLHGRPSPPKTPKSAVVADESPPLDAQPAPAEPSQAFEARTPTPPITPSAPVPPMPPMALPDSNNLSPGSRKRPAADLEADEPPLKRSQVLPTPLFGDSARPSAFVLAPGTEAPLSVHQEQVGEVEKPQPSTPAPAPVPQTVPEAQVTTAGADSPDAVPAPPLGAEAHRSPPPVDGPLPGAGFVPPLAVSEAAPADPTPTPAEVEEDTRPPPTTEAIVAEDVVDGEADETADPKDEAADNHLAEVDECAAQLNWTTETAERFLTSCTPFQPLTDFSGMFDEAEDLLNSFLDPAQRAHDLLNEAANMDCERNWVGTDLSQATEKALDESVDRANRAWIQVWCLMMQVEYLRPSFEWAISGKGVRCEVTSPKVCPVPTIFRSGVSPEARNAVAKQRSKQIACLERVANGLLQKSLMKCQMVILDSSTSGTRTALRWTQTVLCGKSVESDGIMRSVKVTHARSDRYLSVVNASRSSPIPHTADLWFVAFDRTAASDERAGFLSLLRDKLTDSARDREALEIAPPAIVVVQYATPAARTRRQPLLQEKDLAELESAQLCASVAVVTIEHNDTDAHRLGDVARGAVVRRETTKSRPRKTKRTADLLVEAGTKAWMGRAAQFEEGVHDQGVFARHVLEDVNRAWGGVADSFARESQRWPVEMSQERIRRLTISQRIRRELRVPLPEEVGVTSVAEYLEKMVDAYGMPERKTSRGYDAGDGNDLFWFCRWLDDLLPLVVRRAIVETGDGVVDLTHETADVRSAQQFRVDQRKFLRMDRRHGTAGVKRGRPEDEGGQRSEKRVRELEEPDSDGDAELEALIAGERAYSRLLTRTIDALQMGRYPSI